jgi:CheY-like chemotaxis protein
LPAAFDFRGATPVVPHFFRMRLKFVYVPKSARINIWAEALPGPPHNHLPMASFLGKLLPRLSAILEGDALLLWSDPADGLTAGALRIRSGQRCAEEMKILLADDSKFLRMATERAFARAGYSVITAADGEQVLRLALDASPDLILLDIILPKLTGLEVLKMLKKNKATAEIPVVVLTGLSPKNAARLHQDGAFAFLAKSELELDKGCDALLAAVADIVKRLPETHHSAGGKC